MDAGDVIERSESEVNYLDALGRELTADIQRAVYKFALRCCFGLQRRGTRVDPDLAKNLVADAISDTANGDRRWRPDRCTLTQHLRGVVRSRASIIADHNQRFPKVEIAGDDEERIGITLASPRAHPEVTIMRDLARRVLSPLYEAANNNEDPNVMRVLDAYSDGVTKRAEVAELAGITTTDYDRARDRLNRMVTHLPDELRYAMADMLGRRE